MSNLAEVEEMAEKLRQEPYNFIRNDCITKSLRLKRECKARGIPASVVACIGLAKARLFGRWFTIPVLHGWCEVKSKRIETSRPLGSAGIWGIIPINVRPVITVQF